METFKDMSKKILLGDEAIAQAAMDAGISGAYAYPGKERIKIDKTNITGDLYL